MLPAGLVTELVAAGLKTPAARKYWVRAQTAAYIMRLSDQTVAAVRDLRQHPGLFVDPGARFPLPRGSVAIHMRQGDKAKDMELVNGVVYGRLAMTLLDWTTPLYASRIIFALTDGAAALADLSKGLAALPEPRPSLVYVAESVLPRVDLGRQQRVELADGTRPALWLTRLYILQLLIALEADAWVGTRTSNWSRLIDELRCVWVAKCDLPFIEAGLNPPGYRWR